MPPLPTPEDIDIDAVREVAGENDFVYVSSLIDALNDAQWARAQDFITKWFEIEPGDLMGLKGGRDGLRLEDQESLDDIRVRMRLLLGLPEYRDFGLTGQYGSVGVRTTWIY